MTLKELHDATAALGFEDELESANGFFAAANRALYCANRIRPRVAELEVTISNDEDFAQDKEIDGKRYRRIDVRDRCADFLCLMPTPVLRGTLPLRENEDFIVLDRGTVFLPCDTAGLYRIRYFKKLRRLTNDDEEAEIDLDEDICQILPLLVASYVWLEDEEEKAEKYKALFYSEAARIEGFTKKSRYDAYNLDEGWSD